MIKEFEFYHGAVFAKLLHDHEDAVSIKPYPTPGNSSYIVNDTIGIYIKYSKKRMSPWQFSFTKEHQNELLEINKTFGRVYLVLVCRDDGIIALSFKEVKNILDKVHEETEWIRVSRNPREKYIVTGSDGRLPYKTGQNEFPRKLFS